MFSSHVRLDLNALSGPTFQLAPGYKFCWPLSVKTPFHRCWFGPIGHKPSVPFGS